jgi:hypothetical protein
MANAKKDGHPKKDFNAVTRTGLKALGLAQDHKAALEPRLAAGTLDGLSAALQKLGVEVPGALVMRSTAKTATVSQNEALAAGYSLVTGIRTAVQRRGAAADVKKAYGVGAKTNPRVVKQVAAAIRVILERAGADPGEAAALGILQKDLVALADDLAAITSADGEQEKKRAGAPGATKERNRTANRILGAVDVIVAAGVVEFAKDGEVRAAFEALVSSGGGRRQGEEEGGGSGRGRWCGCGGRRQSAEIRGDEGARNRGGRGRPTRAGRPRNAERQWQIERNIKPRRKSPRCQNETPHD